MIITQNPLECARRTVQRFLQEPIADRLDNKKSLSVLDIGCGDGVPTIGLTDALIERYRPEDLLVSGVDLVN